MITRDDLRKMVILRQLTDQMLDNMIPLVQRKHFQDRETVFHQGDMAIDFYMVLKGKVLLEQRLTDKMTVSMDAIKPGYSFGWSSTLQGDLNPYSNYTSDAVCVESCELLAIKGEDLNELMEVDPSMGFIITKRLNRVIKQRLVHRTEQFVRIIRKHPDMENLIS